MKFDQVTWRALLLCALAIAIPLIPIASARTQAQQPEDIAAITSPTDGQEISGLVTITGSANHPAFDRYELAYGPDPNPNDAWQVFATGKQSVSNGSLGTWNAGVVPPGAYTLRLRVVRKDSNYSEAFVHGLHVGQAAPAGTPTSIPPAPTFPAEQPTFDAVDAARPTATIFIEQPPTSLPAAVPAVVNQTPRSSDTRRTSAAASPLNANLLASTCVSGIAFTLALFVVVGVIQASRFGYKQYRRYQHKKSSSHADSQSDPTPYGR